MLSKNEIKERFFNDPRPIDRHGNFMIPEMENMDDHHRFVYRMHYALLEGMPMAEARAILKKHDLSEAEINFLIKKTVAFIEDVLDIPLDQVVAERNSTAGHVWDSVVNGLRRLTEQFQADKEKPIEWRGKLYQADSARSRKTMLDYLATSTVPERWVTLENDYVENFTLEDLHDLYSTIINRDKALFDIMTERKKSLRSAAEENDYDRVAGLLSEWFD